MVVDGRLWRLSNPALGEKQREASVRRLMRARREVRAVKDDAARLMAARKKVDLAKRALGERGAPWWDDGAPDLNRRKVADTPYASWFASLSHAVQKAPGPSLVVKDSAIKTRILTSLAMRDARASTCPSEIARSLSPDDETAWRALMSQVRGVIAAMVRSGEIYVTRGSRTLDANNLSGGPIRIRRGRKFRIKSKTSAGCPGS
jgi:hypothetical protein